MRVVNPVLVTGSLSAVHLIASVSAIGVLYSLSMDRFDHGGDPTAIELALNVVVNVLMFPLFHLLTAAQIRYGAAEWLFVLANSSLWGGSLYLISERAILLLNSDRDAVENG